MTSELEVGRLGAHQYTLSGERSAEYLQLLGEEYRDAVPMGYSFIWFLHALIDTLGGLNDASAVLLGHDVEFGAQPAPTAVIATEVAVAEVTHANGRRTITFDLLSTADGEFIASDKMTVIWPDAENKADLGSKSSGPRPARREPTYGPVLRTGVVTQDQIDRYAEVSEDHNPLHVDVEGAKTGPFGTTIAHGPIALGYALRTWEQPAGDWLPGLSVRARFRSPARPGDHLEVHSVDSAAGEELAVLNQEGRVVVTCARISDEK